ncbi:hypothetical protein [Streptomyces massasporeus]|uniref:hypothetical protein n=1 Tax=Streptomyces massasporeus TaxID=67324 RepID=UPI0037FF87EE
MKAHLAAMHLSGAVLLLTFLLPPAWALDAYGAAPARDPSADVPPFMIFLTVALACVGYHVAVQIPSGLLGTWLGGRNRGAGVVYAYVLAVAAVLTAALSWGVLDGSPRRDPPRVGRPHGARLVGHGRVRLGVWPRATGGATA